MHFPTCWSIESPNKGLKWSYLLFWIILALKRLIENELMINGIQVEPICFSWLCTVGPKQVARNECSMTWTANIRTQTLPCIEFLELRGWGFTDAPPWGSRSGLMLPVWIPCFHLPTYLTAEWCGVQYGGFLSPAPAWCRDGSSLTWPPMVPNSGFRESISFSRIESCFKARCCVVALDSRAELY